MPPRGKKIDCKPDDNFVRRLARTADDWSLFHRFSPYELEHFHLPPISPDSCVEAGGYWWKPVQGMAIYIKGFGFGSKLKSVTRNRMAMEALNVLSTYEVHMGGYHFSPRVILKALRMSGKELRSDELEISYMLERLKEIESIVVNVRSHAGGRTRACPGHYTHATAPSSRAHFARSRCSLTLPAHVARSRCPLLAHLWVSPGRHVAELPPRVGRAASTALKGQGGARPQHPLYDHL